MEIVLLIIAFGAFIAFQVFQGRKRKRETEDRQTKFVPGVEIMTNAGIYGTILSIDDEKNLVEIETTPGTVLKIHRQTLLKVADYDVVATPVDDDQSTDERDELAELDERDASTNADQVTTDATAPEFGERVDTTKPKSASDDDASK